MRLRLLLAAMVLTLGLLPAGVQAETPTWWEQCEALPDEQVEECFYEHNGETPPDERPPSAPTSPLRSYIERVYAETHSVFLNCPGNNRLGENGLACEFRFLHDGTVIKGNAAVEAETETWSHTAWWLTAFHAQSPVPERWRRCALGRHGGFSVSPVRLSTRGTNCAEGRAVAYRISAFDVGDNLRLPHRFNEGEWQTNTLGFVVSRYRCRGRVRVRKGNPNPYGHETATCRTRFGDRITYVFDQDS